MRSNYHTHTYRCNHATGTIEDYVKEAIKANIDEIGISDHLPHPGKNIDNYHRMAYEDLEDLGATRARTCPEIPETASQRMISLWWSTFASCRHTLER